MLVVSISSFSQENLWNQKNPEGEKIGKWRDFYDNGNLRYIGQFKENEPYGTFRNYYPAGKLQVKREFLEPTLSQVTFYYQDGDLMAKGFYLNQEKDSLWQTFGADSNIVSEGNYLKGKKYGIWTIYFPNGKVAEEITYVDDIKNGLYKKYFDNGVLRQEATYVNGLLEGISVFYDPNGLKTLKGKYYRGVRNGKWVYYNEQGVLEKVIEYDMGKNLSEDEDDDIMELNSEQYKDNRKDYLEFEDLKGRIKYNQ